jgi:arylsulfatase A-like enzyme
VRVPCLIKRPGKISPGAVSNGIQSHEDLFVTLAATDLADKLRKGYKVGDKTCEVHLDGYNQMAHWTDNMKSARREFFYYDETDLMALRVDNWKIHIGVKHKGSWWNEKSYPSVPYLFNLRMDPMEKMDPESEEWGYIGRKFFAAKLWAPTAAGPFIAAHLQSLKEFPPSQGTDTLSLHKALERAQEMMENPHASSN